MKKWVAIVLLLLMATPIFVQNSARIIVYENELAFARMIRRMAEGICLVYSERYKTTGFFVSKDGWLITNLHIADKEFISIFKLYIKLDVGLEQVTYESTKIIPHPTYDLLLVKINYKPKYVFRNFRNPYLFEQNWILGFRFFAGKALSNPGYVMLDTNKPYLLRTTACGVAGSSGSPVINSQGVVLGIVVMLYKNTCDTLFIPASVVKSFLEEKLWRKEKQKGK